MKPVLKNAPIGASIAGPPALSGFPCTHPKASGTHQLPCVCRSWSWASRIVGLPTCIPSGLRHGPTSVYLHLYSIAGPPALSRFPGTHPKASDINFLPCDPCERGFVGTCRHGHPEISTRRLRFTAPQEGPLLGSTLHPRKYVP